MRPETLITKTIDELKGISTELKMSSFLTQNAEDNYPMVKFSSTAVDATSYEVDVLIAPTMAIGKYFVEDMSEKHLKETTNSLIISRLMDGLYLLGTGRVLKVVDKPVTVKTMNPRNILVMQGKGTLTDEMVTAIAGKVVTNVTYLV